MDRNEQSDINYFRTMTGLVGLLLLVEIAVAMHLRVDLIPSPHERYLRVAGTAGWGGLVYACWIRSRRISGTALVFVLSVGGGGMAVSLFLLGFHFDPLGVVVLVGTWILNGLGLVWIVQKLRRIRAVANSDEADVGT